MKEILRRKRYSVVRDEIISEHKYGLGTIGNISRDNSVRLFYCTYDETGNLVEKSRLYLILKDARIKIIELRMSKSRLNDLNGVSNLLQELLKRQ